MANKFHEQILIGDIHILHNWEYANATARTGATGLVATDVGKAAKQLDNDSLWVLTNHSPVTWIELTNTSTTADEFVKISAADTTPGFLNAKLAVGGILSKTNINPGANEQLQLTVNDTNTDVAVSVSANDTTPSQLIDKLAAGSGIALVEQNDGGNETLRIDVTGVGLTDEKVKISSNDTTTDFLVNKIVQGPGINIVEQNDGGNETLRIEATGPVTNDSNRYYIYRPREFRNPSNANWAVNDPASIINNPGATAIQVRRFDDTAEEGVGTLLLVPAGMTNVTIRVRGRAQTAPPGNRAVAFNLYWRELTQNGPTAAWGAEQSWDNVIQLTADTNWKYSEDTRTLASQGVNAGHVYLLEFTRDGNAAADTLVGNWLMASMEVEFT